MMTRKRNALASLGARIFPAPRALFAFDARGKGAASFGLINATSRRLGRRGRARRDRGAFIYFPP